MIIFLYLEYISVTAFKKKLMKHLPLPEKESMFLVSLFVWLFCCPLDYLKL